MTAGDIMPDREGFRAMSGRVAVPVTRRVLADAESPLGLYRKLTAGRRGTFLLESAEHGPTWSRYSIIGVDCPAMLAEHEGRAVWLGDPPAAVGSPPADPLAALQATLATLRHPTDPRLPPFTGGLVGYVGYDAVRRFERLPSDAVADVDLPELALMLVADAAVVDHADGSVVLVANAFDTAEADPDVAYDDALARLEAMTAALGTRLPPTVASYDRDVIPAVRSSAAPGDFPKALVRAQEHVRDGECYLLTLDQRFETTTAAAPLDVYRLLRASSPGPYLHLLDFGEFHIVGSSPMGHVKVDAGRAMTHPVAGVRGRGPTPEDDTRRAFELAADPVVQAEHVTLVDLCRGDLARVCAPGSVRLAQFMEVERQRRVMCLASTVVGELGTDRTAFEVFAATFPAPGLTGAPKIRAMHLIEELGLPRRGLYGGGVGYFGLNGSLDLAATAGAAVMRDGRAYAQAGATVTVGTDPDEAERGSREDVATVLSALVAAQTLEPPP